MKHNGKCMWSVLPQLRTHYERIYKPFNLRAMELNIKADLTQTLGIREMHELMEINIRSEKKFECIFIDKKQAQQVIDKLQSWVGKKPDASANTSHMHNVTKAKRLFCPNEHCQSEDIYFNGNKCMCGYCGEKWAI